MNYTLEIALDYLQRGLSIIPLQPQGKTPLLHTWKPFTTTRPTVPQVRGWFNHWPNANIGVITGAVSGVIVLDIDGPDGEFYVQERGGAPHTPISTTGRGRHVWLKHPGFAVRNFVHKLPELDMRADGGYVVAYPSIHPSGRRYLWEIGLETPFAEVPAWLYHIIAPKMEGADHHLEFGASRQIRYMTAYALTALSREAAEVAQNTVDRNNRLYRAALKMGSLIADNKIDRASVEHALTLAAAACGLTAEDGAQQTQRTIASGINRGMESPRGNYSKE
jgi:hypothetical protein